MSHPGKLRPMTDDEIVVSKLLGNVVFPNFTWDLNFGTAVKQMLTKNPPQIDEVIACNLWRMLIRYRRQIKHPQRIKYFRMAEKLMIPKCSSTEYRYAEQAKYKAKKKLLEATNKPKGKTLCEVFAEEAMQKPATPLDLNTLFDLFYEVMQARMKQAEKKGEQIIWR